MVLNTSSRTTLCQPAVRLQQFICGALGSSQGGTAQWPLQASNTELMQSSQTVIKHMQWEQEVQMHSSVKLSAEEFTLPKVRVPRSLQPTCQGAQAVKHHIWIALVTQLNISTLSCRYPPHEYRACKGQYFRPKPAENHAGWLKAASWVRGHSQSRVKVAASHEPMTGCQ